MFINECNNVSFEAYSQLEMRTSDYVFLDFNPAGEFWVHTELVPSLKPEEMFFDISTYHDNAFTPPNVVDSIERRKYNASGEISEFYKVYGLGQVGSLEGVVFDNWEMLSENPKHNTLLSNLRKGSCTYGLDFGFSSDPAVLVRTSIVNDNVLMEEIFYEHGLTNMDIVDRMKKLSLSRNDIVYADSAEPKSIAEIIRMGNFTVRPATKGPDSIRAGIRWLKDKKLFVPSRSTNLIKELRNYVWEVGSDGKPLNRPIDDFNHCIDAIRYSVSNKVTLSAPRAYKIKF